MRVLQTVSLIALTASMVMAGSTNVKAQSLLESVLKSDTGLFSPSGTPPDINTIPTLKNLVQTGATLHYLGHRSQIHGWFVIKDGRVQIVYLSPDKETIIIGALMDSMGRNVTRDQVKYLLQNKPIVAEMMSGANRDLEAIKEAGRDGGIASVASDAKQQKLGYGGSAPSTSLTPGERLIHDMKAAASVKFGNHKTAKIYMMAAPSCPVCKATWKELRTAVKAGEVEVNLIPVYNNVGDKEINQAGQLLLAKDPLKAWNMHADGDSSLLAGQPSAVALKAVTDNLKIVQKWNVQGYPYLVYRGKDGRIKIVQGKPERMAAVLLDLSK